MFYLLDLINFLKVCFDLLYREGFLEVNWMQFMHLKIILIKKLNGENWQKLKLKVFHKNHE